MGALGTSQGRRFRLHPPAHGFAQFRGTEIRACQARDAKRKGKVERPFRDVKERFFEECSATGAPTSLAELNGGRPAGSRSGSMPGCTAAPERFPPNDWPPKCPCSGPCPAGGSTRPMSKPVGSMWPSPKSSGAACATRCHHVAWADASRCARRWRGPAIEIRWAGEQVATHAISDTEGMEVSDAGHFQEAQAAALSPAGAATSASWCPTTLGRTLSLRLDIAGDVDVDVPDLARYENDGTGS